MVAALELVEGISPDTRWSEAQILGLIAEIEAANPDPYWVRCTQCTRTVAIATTCGTRAHPHICEECAALFLDCPIATNLMEKLND